MLRKEALWREASDIEKITNTSGKPDIVITKYRIAVFCDSDYWAWL
jgi:DNA mismatch endonuclease (patch repair protein)